MTVSAEGEPQLVRTYIHTLTHINKRRLLPALFIVQVMMSNTIGGVKVTRSGQQIGREKSHLLFTKYGLVKMCDIQNWQLKCKSYIKDYAKNILYIV